MLQGLLENFDDLLGGDLHSEPMDAKTKLKIQVMIMMPQCAPLLSTEGGYRARSAVLTIKVVMMAKLP